MTNITFIRRTIIGKVSNNFDRDSQPLCKLPFCEISGQNLYLNLEEELWSFQKELSDRGKAVKNSKASRLVQVREEREVMLTDIALTVD